MNFGQVSMNKFFVALILFITLTPNLLAKAQTEPTPNGQFMQHLFGSQTKNFGLYGEESERFGTEVRISGNVAAITAPSEETLDLWSIGVVYIFEYSDESGWVETHRLAHESISGFFNEQIFWTTSSCFRLQGDTLIIGARKHNSLLMDRLIIFQKIGNDWVYQGYKITSNCYIGYPQSDELPERYDHLPLPTNSNHTGEFQGVIPHPPFYAHITDPYKLPNGKEVTSISFYEFIDNHWVFRSSFQTMPGYVLLESFSLSPDGKIFGFLSSAVTNSVYVPSHYEFWRYDDGKWQKYQEIPFPIDSSDHQPYWELQITGSSLIIKKWYGDLGQDNKKIVQVYKEVDGFWVFHTEILLMNHPEMMNDTMTDDPTIYYGQIVLSGENIIVTIVTQLKILVFAFHIPDIEQNVQRVNKPTQAADTLLVLPQPRETLEEQHHGYTRFNLNLTTRPYEKPVMVKLTAPEGVVLDNGGKASRTLTLTFTTENWDIPQTVTARVTSAEATTKSIIIRETFLRESSIEYRKVRPIKIRLTLQAPSFELVSPASNTVITGQPEMVWKPYGLANRYRLIIKNKKGVVVWDEFVTATDLCEELCVYTPTDVPLKKGAYTWRAIAIDDVAGFKLPTPWQGFKSRALSLRELGL